MANSSKPKQWKFIPFKDEIKNVMGSVLGVGAFAVGVLQVFNPIVVGVVAGGYAAFHVLKLGISQLISKKSIASMEKKGVLIPMDAADDFTKRVQEMAKRAGLKEEPKTYFVSDKLVKAMVKSQLPPHLKWLYYIKPIREKMEEKAGSILYAALPKANAVITTESALSQNDFSDKEMDFILAHETGHLKSDKFHPSAYANTIINKATTALLWTTMAVGALTVAGVALPVAVSGLSFFATVGALIGIRHVAKMGPDFARRTIEKRADRNAVYLTRDSDAGESVLTKLQKIAEDKTPSMKKRPEIMEWFGSYPSLPYRIEALKKSFDKASTYPAIANAVDIVSGKAPSNDVDKPKKTDFFTSWSDIANGK